jgi:hypothetical protein
MLLNNKFANVCKTVINQRMGQLLKNILEGARNILVIWPETEYIRPDKHSFQRDNKALRSDSKRVIRDMNRTIKKHGQIDHS